MLDVSTVFDALETYCRRLGGQVPFDYCRRVAQGLPCSQSLVCWEHAFPVGEYMARILTSEEFEQVFVRGGPNRLAAILDAADRAGTSRVR